MARRFTARHALWASLLLALPLTLGSLAVADHAKCPPFERLRYDYVVQFHHGGDLYSTVHVVGFTDFRMCYQIRDRVTEEKIRWESRGGLYELHVVGDGIDDYVLLRSGDNATAWYDHHKIQFIQVVGLSHSGTPTLIPGDEPPLRADLLERLPLVRV